MWDRYKVVQLCDSGICCPCPSGQALVKTSGSNAGAMYKYPDSAPDIEAQLCGVAMLRSGQGGIIFITSMMLLMLNPETWVMITALVVIVLWVIFLCWWSPKAS